MRHRTALRHRYCSLQFDPPHLPSTSVLKGVEAQDQAERHRPRLTDTAKDKEERGPKVQGERAREVQCEAGRRGVRQTMERQTME